MKFTKEEMDFLLNEGNLKVNENENRRDILAEAWEIAAEVETEEANNTTDEEYEANGDRLNDRGMMAVSLVDKLCWSGYREGEFLNLDKLTDEMVEVLKNDLQVIKEQVLTVDKNENLRQHILNELIEIIDNEKNDEDSTRFKLIESIRTALIYRPETVSSFV